MRCRKHMGSTSYPYTCITINKILNSAKPHNKSQFTASLESRIMALQLGNFLWKCRNTMTLILIIVKLCQQFTEDYQKNTGLRGWVLRLRIWLHTSFAATQKEKQSSTSLADADYGEKTMRFLWLSRPAKFSDNSWYSRSVDSLVAARAMLAIGLLELLTVSGYPTSRRACL